VSREHIGSTARPRRRPGPGAEAHPDGDRVRDWPQRGAGGLVRRRGARTLTHSDYQPHSDWQLQHLGQLQQGKLRDRRLFDHWGIFHFPERFHRERFRRVGFE
jgi:hypothetical protein